MKKRIGSIILMLVFLFVLPFSACTSQNQPSDSASTGVDVSQSNSSGVTGDDSEGSENTGETITLQFWHLKSECTDSFQQTFDAYTEEYPNVIIESSYIADFATTAKTYMAAGDFPDFYLANTFQYAGDFVEAGYALDVSDAEFVQYLEETTLSSMTYNDALYGMPLCYDSLGVIYNKDLFKAAGIEEIPTTITGLREVCEKLNSYGVQPFSMSLQDAWIVYQDLSAIHTATLDDLNAFVADMNQGGSMDTPKFRKALETFDLLYEYSNEDNWDTNYSAMTTLFAQEEAAMMIQGDWAIPNVLGVNNDLNIGMFAIPVSDDENANPPLCAGAAGGVIVYPQSQYIDQCLDVLLWLANGNGKDLVGEYTGILTCAKDPYIPQNISDIWTDTMEYVNDGNVVPIGYFAWVSGFDALAGAELQGYLLGELDMDQLMERLDEDWANNAN